MASQAELELQIDTLQAEIATTEATLAELQRTGDDIASINDVELRLTYLQNQLVSVQTQLNNLTTVDDGSDPFVSNGQTTVPTITPSTVTENAFDPGTTFNAGEENVFNPAAAVPTNATGVQKQQARSAATQGDATSSNQQKDWRVRLTLAKSAKYLYMADNPGILQPLRNSEGLVFPYTPQINVSYSAGYDMSDPVHSNYKIFQYKGSSVDNVQISCEFTAQDTNEAQYLLATIHFLRSATKMFYGNDQNPKNGVPPPLVYLTGLGEFQFNNHPLLITNFTYSLPNDVDYIKAGSKTSNPGTSQPASNGTNDSASATRTAAAGLNSAPVAFSDQSAINSDATYVPTKMQISISCIPVVSRNDISNRFSLRDYATGALLSGNSNNAGGIW
jgi:hypothetical protein